MVTTPERETDDRHGFSTPVKIGLAAAAIVGATAGWMAFRRWHTHWGATEEETEGPLPGDELIPDAPVSITHAITIGAPPHHVWPWLAQMGQGRGGFYSYTALENMAGCEMENAELVHPEWQHLRLGDEVRLHPKYPPGKVARLEPERHIVLLIETPEGERISWAFTIRETGFGKTRFVVRLRGPHARGIGILADEFLTGPAHFVMERKMMLTIKRLAEDLAVKERRRSTINARKGLGA